MSIFKKITAVLTAAAILTLSGCAKNEDSDSGVSNVSNTSAVSEVTKVSDSTTISDSTTTAATESTTPVSTQDTAVSDEGTPKENGLGATWNSSNSWESEGKKFSQFDFTLSNSSAADVNGWTAQITFNSNIEQDQIWNASSEINGAVLTARSADYNANIPAGGSVGFGFIVKSSEAPTIKAVCVNGAAIGAAADGSSDKNENTAQTTTATTAATTTTAKADDKQDTPELNIESSGKIGLVSDCGQLSVKGADLVDKNGNPVQLRGVSTHGIQWFPSFVNKNAFKTLRDDWNINVVRIAMYTGEGEGYNNSTKAGIEQLMQDAVDACIELDMYVIVDWHILADQSPQVRKSDALRFFGYMSEKYADYPNVIYEICNEPNGYASWQGDIKPYAEEVIPVIRANAPDSVVIVGTPTWSQDIDKALSDPLSFDNVMYALHYYAATHTDWLRDRAKNCYNSGLPIFVSEFGCCDASGGGGNDFNQTRAWFDLPDSLNISYCSWALADKQETCCMLKPGASSSGGWSDSDLTEAGLFLKNYYSQHG